jgi:hypothetical protein
MKLRQSIDLIVEGKEQQGIILAKSVNFYTACELPSITSLMLSSLEETNGFKTGINIIDTELGGLLLGNILGVYGETESVIFPIPEPPLPGRVSGLEIDLGSDGESNSKEWTGRDAKIKWRPASVTLSYNLNDLEPFGLDSGGLDNYLKDYKVAVYNASGELLREEFVTTEAYVYTYEKNAEDAAKYGDTAYRQLEFKVWARGKQNQLSEQPATL